MSKIQVEAPSTESKDGIDTVCCNVRIRDNPREIWFRAPGPLSSSAEPFFDLALPMAMRTRLPLRCLPPLSAKLQSSVPMIQRRFSERDDQLNIVDVEFAGGASESASADGANGSGQRGTGVFFSGGVDSFDALSENFAAITHLVFVHGFDIKIHDQAAADAALSGARAVAKAAGKELIVVETNLRSFADSYLDWSRHSLGAAAAAVCHLLTPQLRAVYIAGELISEEARAGSRLDLDPLWATEDTTLIHHGHDRSRFRKLERLANDPLAQNYLRVCWQNIPNQLNCGKCSKCLRNMAALRALGALEKFTTFPQPLDLNALAELKLPDSLLVKRGVSEIMEYAEAHGRDPELARAVRQCAERPSASS